MLCGRSVTVILARPSSEICEIKKNKKNKTVVSYLFSSVVPAHICRFNCTNKYMFEMLTQKNNIKWSLKLCFNMYNKLLLKTVLNVLLCTKQYKINKSWLIIYDQSRFVYYTEMTIISPLIVLHELAVMRLVPITLCFVHSILKVLTYDNWSGKEWRHMELCLVFVNKLGLGGVSCRQLGSRWTGVTSKNPLGLFGHWFQPDVSRKWIMWVCQSQRLRSG